MARIPDVTTAPVADETTLAFADFDAEAVRFAGERAKQRDATDAIRATTAHVRGLNEITRTVRQEPDFTSHGEMFERAAAKLTTRSGALIGNAGLREKFLAQAETRTDAARTRVLANVVRAERAQAHTDIDAALQTHFELYTDGDANEPQRVQALAQLNDMIALAGARGLFTPDEVEEKRQRFLVGAVKEDAALQVARDPRRFLIELAVDDGRFAVLPEEDRVVMARAAAGQAIAAAIDANPAGIEEVLADPLVAKNLIPEEQDKARDDTQLRLEAIKKSKATEAIRAVAAATPALVARAEGLETLIADDGTAQPAGAPLTVAEADAMIARLKEGGARPEAVQLHEELHAGLIARGGPKQAAVEAEVFAGLMQAISDARIVDGKLIDVEASMTALVDVQARVLRAQREGQITSAQAESLLTRVIPAVMAGIERDGVDGAGPESSIADLYESGFAFIGDLLAGTGEETNPALAASLFSALADRIDRVDPQSLTDPEKKAQAQADIGRAIRFAQELTTNGQPFGAAAQSPVDFDAERRAGGNADVDVAETPEQGADEPVTGSVEDELDKLQLALDIAGLAPGAGIVPDALNTLISIARGNLGDAGLSLLAMAPVIGQAAGAAKIAKNARRISKNSLDFVGDTHVYRITGPKGVHKIGESAQGTRKRDGASKRAELQARKLQRETGDYYETKILETFPGKRSARKRETRLIEQIRRRLGPDALPGNKTNR